MSVTITKMLIEAKNDLAEITPAAIYWLCEEGETGVALAVLAGAECAFYDAFRRDKRRHDWLLGRLVAKRLIGRVMAAIGYRLAPIDIVILPHPDGWPQVALPALGPDAPPLTLSISHAGERAFCTVALGDGRPLGCDLERIELRSSGFVADYFTAEERDFMAATPPTDHAMLANAIWSGKEAALKAIRRGLAEDTRLVTCIPAPEVDAGGWRPLYYSWEAVERGLPALTGRWRMVDGFVMTLATSGGKHPV